MGFPRELAELQSPVLHCNCYTASVLVKLMPTESGDTLAFRVLKAAPLFAALSDAEVEYLTARTEVRSYAPDEMLFTEGEPCTGLHLVASGRVRIFKSSANGREQVLAVDGPGSSVAELPVFDVAGIRFGIQICNDRLYPEPSRVLAMAGATPARVQALLLGGPSGPGIPGLATTGVVNAWIMPVFWFTAKLLILLFCTVWLRAALPRLRYDRLMNFGWKVLLPVSLLNILATAVAMYWKANG